MSLRHSSDLAMEDFSAIASNCQYYTQRDHGE